MIFSRGPRMRRKLTFPAYWTTIILFLIISYDFYISSVQLSVKNHSLSLSQCHIQIIKKWRMMLRRKILVNNAPKTNFTALLISSFELAGFFLGFIQRICWRSHRLLVILGFFTKVYLKFDFKWKNRNCKIHSANISNECKLWWPRKIARVILKFTVGGICEFVWSGSISRNFTPISGPINTSFDSYFLHRWCSRAKSYINRSRNIRKMSEWIK